MATRKAKTTQTTKPAKTTRSTKKVERVTKATTPKTEKKTAEKKVTERPVTTSVASTSQTRTAPSGPRLPQMKVRKSYLIAGLVLLGLLALAWYYRSLFVVATVNGQPITRLSYIQELERMSGQQALNALVTKSLILQEAREKNVSVNDDEVNKEIKQIEDNLKQQGQDLTSVLALQGLTQDALREQIYLQKLVEKMVGDKVKVTDEEVSSYIESNQETLPEGQSEEEQRQNVREQLRQQKLNEQVQTWLQELQQKAQINYLVSQK